MNRKKKKKKFKPQKLDYTNLSKEDLREELIKTLRTINLPGPSQKQIESVEKNVQILGKEAFHELINLLITREGNDRDRVFLVLMGLNFPEIQEDLKNILTQEDRPAECKKAAFTILFCQGISLPENQKKVILPYIDKLKNDLLKSKSENENEIDKFFKNLPLIDKFLVLYMGLIEEKDNELLDILCRSDIPKVRLEVASKLEKLDNENAVKPLLKLREDKDSDVRNAAKKAIGFLRNKGIEFFEKVKELPFHCCYITKDIKKNGLGTVLIARKARDNYINYAFFLIDIWGMGLKDVFGERRCHRLKFDKEVLPRFQMNPYGEIVEENIVTAKKLILGGAEFASKNGFKIPKEFLKWKDLIGTLTEDEKNYSSLFGKNGETIVMASPEDIMKRIIMDGDTEEYYDDRKLFKPEHSFEMVIKKLESRNIKLVTSLGDEIPEELIDILADKEERVEDMRDLTEEVSHTISVAEPEEETSTAISVAEPEEETSTAISVAEPEEEISIAISAAEPEEETSTAISVAEPEEEISTAISAAEPEEEASPAISAAKPEKEVHAAISVAEPEEEISTAISGSEPEEEVSPLSIPLQEKSKPSIFKSTGYRKKALLEDFDMAMENMYDDLEEFIFEEQYHKAYIHLDKMLKRASGTSWEEGAERLFELYYGK